MANSVDPDQTAPLIIALKGTHFLFLFAFTAAGVVQCGSRLFVCVVVLQPCQQLRSCRASQLPINTVPGQA